MQCSAASRSLEGYVAAEDSTSVRRLRNAGSLIVGTANMDEFGMGSYGQNGYKGSMVRNPINEEYFPGGSSAGSAAAVKSYQALGSLGTDTGGSIGMPSHCCGLFGLKPSFGRVSRHGLILYSSSSDVNGPLAHSTSDLFHIFNEIQGADENDSNCIDFGHLNPQTYRDEYKSRVLDQSTLDLQTDEQIDLKGLKIGILEEFQVSEMDGRNKSIQKQVLELLESYGAQISIISIPLLKYALPYHYSLVPSEAASNLARIDGIRYGYQP